MNDTTTGDRELLELAAKAAGFTLTWGEVFQVGGDVVDCTDLAYIVSNDREDAPAYWNPLESDGDALRLAVKLEIQLLPLDNAACAVNPFVNAREVVVIGDGDPYAATRRAIVGAAAKIGQAM